MADNPSGIAQRRRTRRRAGSVRARRRAVAPGAAVAPRGGGPGGRGRGGRGGGAGRGRGGPGGGRWPGGGPVAAATRRRPRRAAAAAAVAARGGGERDREGSELVENVIAINRVAKVVKGGRRFSLQRAGRRRRRAGQAWASRPARRTKCPRRCARRSTPRVAAWCTCRSRAARSRTRSSGKHGAGRVLMKPAAPGAGVIAGGAVRAIIECAGISDILTKSLGSTNPHNMVRAAMQGSRS